MDQMRQIEALFSILVALFDTQVNTLYVLDGHRIHSEIVHRTGRLARALLNYIEASECEFNQKIEKEADHMLENSATLVNVIAEATKAMPEMEILKELYSVVKNEHQSFTTSLDEETRHVDEEIAMRFNLMKMRTNAILSQIEKM